MRTGAISLRCKSEFIEMFGDPIASDKWPKRAISDFAEVKIGPFGSVLHKDDCIHGGHPLINPSHIKNGCIEVDLDFTISDEMFASLSAYQMFVGDIVLGRRGEMGRCALVTTDGMLCGTGGHDCSLR